MKKHYYILSFIFLFCCTAFSVSAISISPPGVLVQFEPSLEQSVRFQTQPSKNTGITIEGNLEEYVQVEKDTIAENGQFIIKVSLPEALSVSGDNIVYVGVAEKSGSGGTVQGVAAIRSAIVVRVPYPGFYAELAFYAQDLNYNETAQFSVNINNRGKEDIDAVATIEVFNAGNELVETLNTNRRNVSAGTENTIFALFNASKHEGGEYTAIAHVSYGGEQKDLTDTFRIGTLYIDVLNHTKQFISGEVERFWVDIASNWNRPIQNVYADIIITNSSYEDTFRTPTINLENFGKGRLETFWDVSEVGRGTYDASINVRYDGLTTIEEAVLTVISKEEAQGEQPFSFSATLSSLTVPFLILLVIALIIANVLIIKRKKREKE